MSVTPIHVLHVDDNADFRDLVSDFLTQGDDRISVTTAEDATHGREILASRSIDCIVSDYEMPGGDGLELLESVRDEYGDIPFILFTGKGSEEIASRAISAGVTDYLQKGGGADTYEILANRITNAVERCLAERDASHTERKLRAITDSATDAIVTIDRESVVQFANPAVEDVFGYTPDELEGESLATLMPERLWDDHRDGLTEYLDTSERGVNWGAIEVYGRRKDGSEIPLSVSYSEFTLDGEVYFTGILRDVSERVRLQQQIRQEERKLYELGEQLHEIVWMTDPTRRQLLYVNPRYEEIWGRSPEGLLDERQSFLDTVHPEDRDRVAEFFDTLPLVEYDVEYRVVHPEQGTLWIRERSIPVPNEQSEIERVIGVAENVTETKQREQEHERALDLLDHTEEVADVGGWEIDTETQAVFWTDHLFEMLGVEYDEEPPLEEALDVYVEEDRPRVETAVEEALAAGDSFDVEARYERPDGERRWFRIRGEPTVEDGEVVTLRGAVQDITDHKQHKAELERVQAFFTEAERLGDLGAWEFDTDGNVVWTDGTRRIHEVDAAYEPTLKEGIAFCHPADRDQIEDAVENARTTGQPYDLEVRLITAEGNERWVRTRGAPAEGAEETIRGFIQDITDRKRREQRLERQNDRLDEFASVVSHDLRTPLSVVEGRLELAREECESTHLDSIGDATDRMNSIIDNVLWLAREGQDIGDTETVALQPMVADAWTIVGDDHAEAELVLAGDPDRWDPIRADSDRLRQLLDNLFRNAIDHAGPDVTVRFETTDTGFAVEDDGPGIPDAERDRVFESGYSTATEGIGFGLTIVKQIVDAHGWEIRVTDGSEGGARFEITGVEFGAE